MTANFAKRMVIDKQIMAGKPVIRGTRIPVYAIVKRFAEGWTIEKVLEDYPRLTKEDIYAALEYSAEVLKDEELINIAQK